MKILVVDDDMDFRALVPVLLRRSYPHVVVADYDPRVQGLPPDDFPWADFDVVMLDHEFHAEHTGLDWLRRFARLFPRQAVEMLIRGRRSAGDLRLVEKSVHAGLWLPLVDAVFPDALYLHITRDPGKSVPSIMTGWRDAERFVSFHLPEPLDIDGLDGSSRDWCFPLPPGWRDASNADLQSVAAFQWCAINESILAFFDAEDRATRCHVVRLEDLVASPGDSLRAIRRHCEIDDMDYFDAFENGLPVVNKREERGPPAEVERDRLWDDARDVAERLGYQRTS